ncbi:transketolase [Deinococcus peraridilitoris]|uniref:Transketolase n=1 Tax=Deinococcus peraridilitoris (strain DSM 19664 / LMG 22246 / CIP 109416 / KR-200) TaxID=937777 RepID=L0A0X5_DEIPD|nr:transketolase [Deinococcus peraridilitoris]AFZ67501.1 transketolase [Deinococcus peraridilitoris DSM 19664]
MTTPASLDVETLSINSIRTLSIDAVQQANSGHPGAPLGMAPMAYVLWQHFLRHNPRNPLWMGRDRFVLSAGHASMLIYSLLHLTGYDMPLEELRNFRQWGSKTPGHPEFFHTPGLDATTGPLGQGAAMTVGMAMAEAHLAARYNREGFELFNNHTYALVSDGDLQEGISHEAASLAGHLRLGKLIWLYDDNDIQLDTPTNVSFSDETSQRFEAYGWRVLMVHDGNDTVALQQAIHAARHQSDRPTLIRVKTIIGYGSPNKSGTSKAHGEPLGTEEVRLTKQALNWPYQEPFTVPDEVRAHMDARERGARQEREWTELLDRYKEAHPELAGEIELALRGDLPEGWNSEVPTFEAGGKPMATRNASGTVLNALAKRVPQLIGGSADLAGSTKTNIIGEEFTKIGQFAPRNIYFGVREHGMAAAANGMSLYSGLRPYVGTFLVFSDYLKPALRLSALMHQPVIYVLTHDSIGLGEDGPTHQPIEQLAQLRATPSTHVYRPADANETAAVWQLALERKDGPSALVFSRQDLPILPRNHQGVRRGAYVVREAEGKVKVILIATGSEVHVALEAAEALAQEGIGARVVSMPCMELFRAQDGAYRDSILTPGVKRVAIEAASPFGWHEWTGSDGAVIAMTGFGASAPAKTLLDKFGFSSHNIAKVAKSLL